MSSKMKKTKLNLSTKSSKDKSTLEGTYTKSPTVSHAAAEHITTLLSTLSDRSQVAPRVAPSVTIAPKKTPMTVNNKNKSKGSISAKSLTNSASSLSTITSSGNANAVWAKGTGFGASSISTAQFDPYAHSTERKRMDNDLAVTLAQLISCLQTHCCDMDEALAVLMSKHHSHRGNADVMLRKDQLGCDTGDYNVLRQVLSASCLLPFLARQINNDSVLDMCRHTVLYTAVFELLRLVVDTPSLRGLISLPVMGIASGGTVAPAVPTLKELTAGLYGRMLAYWRLGGAYGEGVDDVVRTHLDGRADDLLLPRRVNKKTEERAASGATTKRRKSLRLLNTRGNNDLPKGVVPTPLSLSPTPSLLSDEEMLRLGLTVCHAVSRCKCDTDADTADACGPTDRSGVGIDSLSKSARKITATATINTPAGGGSDTPVAHPRKKRGAGTDTLDTATDIGTTSASTVVDSRTNGRKKVRTGAATSVMGVTDQSYDAIGTASKLLIGGSCKDQTALTAADASSVPPIVDADVDADTDESLYARTMQPLQYHEVEQFASFHYRSAPTSSM